MTSELSRSRDLRLDDLRSALGWLRSQLAPGAPIVPLASVRARDRAEAVHGVVMPLGLASSLFYDEQFGDYAAMDKPRVYLFDGVLSTRHIQALIPLFEQVARDRAPLVMAATDVDEDVLAMVAMNKKRGAMRGAVLVPDSPRVPMPLFTLQRLTGGGLGSASEQELRIGAPALAARVLATLHATVFFSTSHLASEPPNVGLLHVGGEDMEAARTRTEVAREMTAHAASGLN